MLIKDYDADTFRFFVLSTHYRSPIDFSKESLHQSEKSLDKIKKYYESLECEILENVDSDYDPLRIAKEEFFKSMDDDFNTPKAIAAIFGLINNSKNEIGSLANEDIVAIRNFLDDVSSILGINFMSKDNASSDELLNVISEVRQDLRKNKQYDLSDKIRDQLTNLGYEVSD